MDENAILREVFGNPMPINTDKSANIFFIGFLIVSITAIPITVIVMNNNASYNFKTNKPNTDEDQPLVF